MQDTEIINLQRTQVFLQAIKAKYHSQAILSYTNIPNQRHQINRSSTNSSQHAIHPQILRPSPRQERSSPQRLGPVSLLLPPDILSRLTKPSYGPNDELGTLNRLTDEVVKSAASEIKTGTRISLNWPLDAQGDIPFFGRQAFHKEVYQKPPRIVNDDVWTVSAGRKCTWLDV